MLVGHVAMRTTLAGLALFALLSACEAGFGLDKCKDMACFENYNNAGKARWKGDTRTIKYLGEYETAAECETACISFSNKKGDVCKSFSWHDSDPTFCTVKRKCWTKQCYAVIDDTWDPKEMAGVHSGRVGRDASSILNKVMHTVYNATAGGSSSSSSASSSASASSSSAKKDSAKGAAPPSTSSSSSGGGRGFFSSSSSKPDAAASSSSSSGFFGSSSSKADAKKEGAASSGFFGSSSSSDVKKDAKKDAPSSSSSGFFGSSSSDAKKDASSSSSGFFGSSSSSGKADGKKDDASKSKPTPPPKASKAKGKAGKGGAEDDAEADMQPMIYGSVAAVLLASLLLAKSFGGSSSPAAAAGSRGDVPDAADGSAADQSAVRKQPRAQAGTQKATRAAPPPASAGSTVTSRGTAPPAGGGAAGGKGEEGKDDKEHTWFNFENMKQELGLPVTKDAQSPAPEPASTPVQKQTASEQKAPAAQPQAVKRTAPPAQKAPLKAAAPSKPAPPPPPSSSSSSAIPFLFAGTAAGPPADDASAPSSSSPSAASKDASKDAAKQEESEEVPAPAAFLTSLFSGTAGATSEEREALVPKPNPDTRDNSHNDVSALTSFGKKKTTEATPVVARAAPAPATAPEEAKAPSSSGFLSSLFSKSGSKPAVAANAHMPEVEKALRKKGAIDMDGAWLL